MYWRFALLLSCSLFFACGPDDTDDEAATQCCEDATNEEGDVVCLGLNFHELEDVCPPTFSAEITTAELCPKWMNVRFVGTCDTHRLVTYGDGTSGVFCVYDPENSALVGGAETTDFPAFCDSTSNIIYTNDTIEALCRDLNFGSESRCYPANATAPQ